MTEPPQVEQHRLLRRQLMRHFTGEVPPEMDGFVRDVGNAYRQADEDRLLVERSLELASQELSQRNEDLRKSLVASGSGTFTVAGAGRETTSEGYPHPLTGKVGRCYGSLSDLLGSVAPAERDDVISAFDEAFTSGREVNVKVTVGERCVVLRGGIRVSDGGSMIAGVCLDITEQETTESSRRRHAEEHRRVLFGLTRSVAEAGEDFALAIRLITEATAATLEVEMAGVWLNEPERGIVSCLDLFERTPARHSSGQSIARVHLGRYLEAIGGARILAVDDALHDPRLAELVDPHLRPLGVTSMLDAPVRVAGQLRAFVCHEHVGPPRVWSPEEEAFAASTADLVALVLETRLRHMAEIELERQRAFLRQVIDLNPNLIFAKDRHGRFTLVNKAMAECYGTTVDELLGKTDADFNPDTAQVAVFRERDLQVMDSLRECFVPEETLTDAQGRRRIMQLVKRPIIDANGGADQILGVATDISDRKHAEEERRKLEITLRQAQKMESVGLLAGGLAHDFNNLLTPILAYAEQAPRLIADGHPILEDLAEIVNAAKQARDITAQLMAFGRKQMLKVKPLSLNEVVTQVRRMLTRLIPENIDIKVDLAPMLPAVLADPTQIQQIIINLAANARDAMPDGGTLTIATRDEGTHVRLSVTDTGSGIDPGILPHIFEPFFTTREMGRGTGLGLASVYGIVNQHGGTIDVVSELGRGTAFTIVLERAPSRAEPAPAPATSADERGHETVLVVEDEQLVRKLVARMLTIAGFRVLTIGDPVEALELAQSHPGEIHLLLTDVVMPKMNGKELFDRLSVVRPTTRVVFMSGHAQDFLGRHGVLSEGTAFVSKPFVQAELTRVVRETLDKSA
jgi:PAS domain S-box-containing protein